MNSPTLFDQYFVIASFLLLIGYHLIHYWYTKMRPMGTAFVTMNTARQAWVKSMLEGKRDILAVQTLRNLVMASTFLASTAVLICLGIVSTSLPTTVIDCVTSDVSYLHQISQSQWMLKILVLATHFFVIFFNFTLAIRYYNHCSLIITLAPESTPIASVESATSVLNRGALHYTLGMRGYYLAVPLGLWLFNAKAMLVGTVILIIMLYYIDRKI